MGKGQWAMVLLLGLSQAQVYGQEKIDATGLEDWLGKVRPGVEKILGYALPRTPQVQLVDDAQVDLEGREIALHLRARFPHLREQTFAEALRDAVAVSGQALVARHVEGSATIAVYSRNNLKMPRWPELLKGSEPVSAPSSGRPAFHDVLKETASLDFVRLAALQELVRYALDSRYNLGRLREACRDADEWLALQALVEGRVQWVTRQAAHQLRLERYFPLLTIRYLYVPDVSADPGLRASSQSVIRQRFWACGQGLAFWTHLEGCGKADEKSLFAQPPRQVKWIQQPEAYLRAASSPRPDLAAAFTALEPQLSGEWASMQQAWTPTMFVQVASLLNEKDRAVKVTQGWDEGRTLMWMWKSRPDHQVALSVVRYESVPGARGYYGFALDLQRKRDELSNQPCGLPLKVIESRTHPINLTGVDEAVFFEKKMQYVNGTQTVNTHILLARQGDCVVELTWYGLPADTAWAQRMLDALPK